MNDLPADPLQAPFPWIGGKSRVAHIVWKAFGDVPNYVEPFFGSGAVLLGRPHAPKIETVNDADGLLCVAPHTRILGEDLRWREAGDIRIGDKLVGFDESNGIAQTGVVRRADRPDFQPPQSMRKWRIATVTNIRRLTKPSYKLIFEDGTIIICSADHLWLAGKSKSGGRGARWIKTSSLRCDASQYCSHVMKLCDVVDQIDNAAAGWIGGFYDGEGNVQGLGSGWRLSVSQKLGQEADRVESWLLENGFSPVRGVVERDNQKHQPVACITFNGGMRETLRFLMLTRPERLIRNALDRIHTRSIYGRARQVVALVSKEFIGDTDVVAIETDTHTYIAEGLASHNCNFWRSIKLDPVAVAEHADWPANECDLHARHLWLVEQRERITARLHGDPEYYDAKLAGWWVWGCCSWIGSGWCSGKGPWGAVEDDEGYRQLVHLGNAGRGINRKLVHLGDAGRGINRKLVHLGDAGRGINRKLGAITEWFAALADRLRGVRVCCGDWTRILGPTPTEKRGITAVFLDPPYGTAADRADDCYAIDSTSVAGDVLAWCKKNGANPMLRIALCGYEGEHDELTSIGWAVHAWKTQGGYGNQGDGNGRDNAARERIWFSHACLPIEAKQPELFSWETPHTTRSPICTRGSTSAPAPDVLSHGGGSGTS